MCIQNWFKNRKGDETIEKLRKNFWCRASTYLLVSRYCADLEEIASGIGSFPRGFACQTGKMG